MLIDSQQVNRSLFFGFVFPTLLLRIPLFFAMAYFCFFPWQGTSLANSVSVTSDKTALGTSAGLE
jgi:hypothetical protein